MKCADLALRVGRIAFRVSLSRRESVVIFFDLRLHVFQSHKNAQPIFFWRCDKGNAFRPERKSNNGHKRFKVSLYVVLFRRNSAEHFSVMKGCERNVCEKKYKACVCACGTHPSSAGGYENSAFNSGGERASGGSHRNSKRID